MPVNMLYVWSVTAGLLLIIELLTVSLVTIWFAAGAAAAAVCAGFGLSCPIQVGVFAGVSLLLLALMRPIAVYFQKAKKKIPTNADSLIGREAVVKSEVNNLQSTGSVIVSGQEWSAKSRKEDQIIPAGIVVKISGIQGNKLVVTIKSEPDQKNN